MNEKWIREMKEDRITWRLLCYVYSTMMIHSNICEMTWLEEGVVTLSKGSSSISRLFTKRINDIRSAFSWLTGKVHSWYGDKSCPNATFALGVKHQSVQRKIVISTVDIYYPLKNSSTTLYIVIKHVYDLFVSKCMSECSLDIKHSL